MAKLTFVEIFQGKYASIRLNNQYTVKSVYNEHPRGLKFVAVVDRWSLLRGSFKLQ
jgi:hypothetical protein